jgi:hypothetical protein
MMNYTKDIKMTFMLTYLYTTRLDFEYNEEAILDLFKAEILYPQNNNIYKINWVNLHKIILESNKRYGCTSSQKDVVCY